MIYQNTLGGPTGQNITPLVSGSMWTKAFLGLIFRSKRISKPPRYKPLFSLPIFIAFEALFGPKFGAFERPKSRQSIFQANTQKLQKLFFSKVLATLAVIFLPFRTREFIAKYNRIAPRSPFCPLKYCVSVNLIEN